LIWRDLNIQKSNKVALKEQYELKTPKKCAALKNLDDDDDDNLL
jgi:hypothetical protein